MSIELVSTPIALPITPCNFPERLSATTSGERRLWMLAGYKTLGTRYSTMDISTVAPPVAKFGTSATMAAHSGRDVTSFIMSALSNQPSKMR